MHYLGRDQNTTVHAACSAYWYMPTGKLKQQADEVASKSKQGV